MGKENCDKVSREKEIKWNLKQVRPEVFQCFRRIVEDLKDKRQDDNRRSEKIAVQPSQNGQTSSKEEANELPLHSDSAKQGADKGTTSEPSVPSTTCPKIMVPPQVTYASPGSIEGTINDFCSRLSHSIFIREARVMEKSYTAFTI